jgi:hypothetical protein
MAATMTTSADLSSSTAIEQHMRSREELAEQLAVLRLDSAAEAARAWRQLRAPHAGQDGLRQKSLPERFERVTGRPLANACPARCGCRGVPEGDQG